MTRKYLYPSALALVAFCLQIGCTNNTQQSETSEAVIENPAEFVDRNIEQAAAQYQVLMEKLPAGKLPKTYYASTDKFETSGSEWWTSGFYPGTLMYLYEETGDQALLDEAKRVLKLLEKEQYNTTTHDLGFMMFGSFGHANRIEPSEEYKQILLNSAKSLASRYDPDVKAIKSWDSDNPKDFLVIIDNMMNLDLLFWATRETGDSTYHKIATEHANTTMKHHFRPDYSSYHVVNYNAETGEVQLKRTEQGNADDSAWARGQAWGLYGYTMTYRETKDPRYLEQAKKIADFMLNHPNLPEDKVPYWDFNAPGIPNAKRDASAAAITASALLELSTYVDGQDAKRYFNSAETMLKSLSEEPYKAEIGENGGFILKHGVGHLPKNSEVDVPLTYGDHYYVEALTRYKDLKKAD